MTAITSEALKRSTASSSSSMPRPAPLLSRNQKLLLLIACISLSLVLYITHACTTPPALAIERPGMDLLFGRHTKQHSNDPNSIDGRIPIGYWQDGGPKSVENAVDEDWDPAEREMVMNYLKLADDKSNEEVRELKSWRGLSFCRVCEEATGNSCMGDNQYNWPQGYLHYFEKHNVKPPKEFIDHVRQRTESMKK